jgi:hypothetical protein
VLALYSILPNQSFSRSILPNQVLLFSLVVSRYNLSIIPRYTFFHKNASLHLYYFLLLFHQHVNELLCQSFFPWRWLKVAYLTARLGGSTMWKSFQLSAIRRQLTGILFSGCFNLSSQQTLPVRFTTYFLLLTTNFLLSPHFSTSSFQPYSCVLSADSCQLSVENIGPDSYRDEPMTSQITSGRAAPNHSPTFQSTTNSFVNACGEYRSRTDDLLLAKQAL